MVRELARAGLRLAKTAGGSAPPPALADALCPRAVADALRLRAVAGDLAGVPLQRALRPRAAAGDLAGAPLPRASRPPLRVSAGLPLHRTVAGLPLHGQPLQRTVAGLHPFRRIHTVVVVVDEKIDPATAERLAKVVKEALQDPGKTAETPAVEEDITSGPVFTVVEEEKNSPNISPEARDAAKRKYNLRRSKDQRMLQHVHSCVKRLAAGNAPPRLQHAFSQLSTIKEVLELIKSEGDEAKKKLEDEKLWIYAFRDRLLDKLPPQVRAWYDNLRALWEHCVDIYPFVVLVVVLTTFSPFLLFGMALLAHDKYLEKKKQELTDLSKEYEELLKKNKEGHGSCVGSIKTAVSIWLCLRRRLIKALSVASSSSTTAAQVPQATKDGPEQATRVVSTPPLPPQGSSMEVPGSSPLPPQACKELPGSSPPPPPLQAGAEANKK